VSTPVPERDALAPKAQGAAEPIPGYVSIVTPCLNEELVVGEFVDWCHEGLERTRRRRSDRREGGPAGGAHPPPSIQARYPLPVVAGVLLTVVSTIAAVAVLVWDVAAGIRRFTARRGAERR
jgi:hypothetical protein